jgi:hypothetical protein
VADGAYDLFALYDTATGGEPIWSETQRGVVVSNRQFLTTLGSIEPIPATALGGRTGWLAVSVAVPAAPAVGAAGPHDHRGEKTLIALLPVVTLLAVGSTALAQTGEAGSAPTWRVQPGTSSDGSYQLASLSWPVSSTITGEGYALTSPYTPALRGSGCCCTYLPCILRSW